MSAQTGISWTDSTFNPWMGCTKVSPACDDCYAARSTPVRATKTAWGPGAPRKRTAPSTWEHPERWNRAVFCECATCGWRGEERVATQQIGYGCTHTSCPSCHGIDFVVGARRRVFSASLGDWLDNEVPIEWLVDFLDLVRRTPNLDWLLLTKRIGNWRTRLQAAANYCAGEPEVTERNTATGMWIVGWLGGSAPKNVWIGATMESQPVLDRDAHKLIAVPAAVRFLSMEPLLGPVTIPPVFIRPIEGTSQHGMRFIDWIIAGGESGAKARSLDMLWIRSLVQQCANAGAPIHVKQLGRTPFFGDEGAGWAYDFFNGGDKHWRPDYRLLDGSLGVLAIHDREGRDVNEWPEDLCVQEFPRIAA